MDVLLKNFSTMGIGGKGKLFLPQDEKEFVDLLKFHPCCKVIGNGSNILFGDEVDKVIISTRLLKQKLKIENDKFCCSCGISLYEAFKYTSKHNLGGFERLALIPATIGGAIKNNASCFEQTVSEHLVKLKIFDGKKVRYLKKEDIAFAYHSSSISGVILQAQFKLPVVSECQLFREFAKYRDIRLASQPQGKSLGSIFKNPATLSAGRLIEECSLKGKRIGDAMISDKHANIFLNMGNASFDDMTSLIKLTQKQVEEKFGICLDTEIEIISSKKEDFFK